MPAAAVWVAAMPKDRQPTPEPDPRRRYVPVEPVRGTRRKPLPTTALPGSEEKLRILIERQRQGQELHTEGDTVLDMSYEESAHLLWERHRNGSTTVVGVAEGSVTNRLQENILGDRVRIAREQAGLSRKALALRAGVSQMCLSRIERHERTPRLDVLIAIADALGLSLDRLVGRTPPAA